MRTQGQALLIVVAFLAMFFIIGVAFFLLSQTEQLSSVKHLDAIRSRYIAEAGIAYAKRILELDKDTNAVDSLQDMPFVHFADGAAWFTIIDSDSREFGRFNVKVADEAGKLNLNSCSQDELERLLALCGVDTEHAAQVISERPYDALEQVGSLLGEADFEKLRGFVTVYSRDWEFDLDKKRRPYLNAANPQLVLDVFVKEGIEDARQKAAMLIDAADTDVAETVFSETALNYVTPSGMIDGGGWVNKGNYFEAQPGTASGVFIWTNLVLEDGEYECFLYGVNSDDAVGAVAEQYIRSGDKLSMKLEVTNNAFSLAIAPVADAVCRLSHVALVKEGAGEGMQHSVITGTEALSINEIMVYPVSEHGVGLSVDPGHTAQTTVTVADLRPGFYHLQVVSPGFAGDVTVEGLTGSSLDDGDFLPQAVEVKADLSLDISIKNNDQVKTASLSAVRLSQQPDGEYIELLNLSPYQIDLSDFTIEVLNAGEEMVSGWPGRIPSGTLIEPFQYLVLNVDANDGSLAPEKLKGNTVSFRKIWGFSGVNLYFEDYHEVIERTFDLFPDTEATVYLKDTSGRVVDSVEYGQVQLNSFTSIERGDPAARIDDDNDGAIDGWYASNTNNKGTPGVANENLGMYTEEEGVLTKHLPSEAKVFNRALNSLAEVAQISSGNEWQLFSLSDIARIADSFAYTAEFYPFAESGSYTLPAQGASAEWEFHNVTPGIYWLGIEGIDAPDAQVRVSAFSSLEQQQTYTSRVFEGNLLPYGVIEITGMPQGGGDLFVRIINDSAGELKLKQVILEPVVSVSGRINVNTAGREVLRSVIPSDALVDTLMNSRVIGNMNDRLYGIGDLFLIDPAFLTYHNALTVKSDTYELKAYGERLLNEEASASDTIRIIYERGD